MSTTLKIAALLLDRPSERITAFAETCLRLTPRIAICGEIGVIADLRGMENFHTVAGFEARAHKLAERLGHRITIAWGERAGDAMSWARLGMKSGDLAALPLTALPQWANPFCEEKSADFAQELKKSTEKLERLGVKTFGEWQRLPAHALGARFGRATNELHACLRGEHDLPWPVFRPTPNLEEIEACESESLEELQFIFKATLDRIMARLHGRGERLTALGIELGLERSSVVEESSRRLTIRLPLSQGSSVTLLPIVREQWSTEVARNPLPSRVQQVRLKVLESAPGRSSQRGFFDNQEEQREAFEAVVSRLALRLGRARVFLAHEMDRHLPEASWERGLTSPPPLQPHRELAPRPLRLLAKPLPLQVNGEWIVCFGTKHRWKPLQWEGPEILAGEWWARGFKREYYRVATEAGEWLWIFQETKGTFLHGYWD